MPTAFHELAKEMLPNLHADNYRITSAATWDYNCIAWAVGDIDVWWWPTPGRFWPPGVPREENLEAFAAALATRGFALCSSTGVDVGLEKIVVYAKEGIPTHAARQLRNGWWTSKLGPSVDIEHSDVEAVSGGAYGEPALTLCRSVSEA